MRTWLDVGGRKVQADVVTGASGGTVTASADVRLSAHGPDAPTALKALGQRITRAQRMTAAEVVRRMADQPLDAGALDAAVAAADAAWARNGSADTDELVRVMTIAAVRRYFATVIETGAAIPTAEAAVRSVRR